MKKKLKIGLLLLLLIMVTTKVYSSYQSYKYNEVNKERFGEWVFEFKDDEYSDHYKKLGYICRELLRVGTDKVSEREEIESNILSDIEVIKTDLIKNNSNNSNAINEYFDMIIYSVTKALDEGTFESAELATVAISTFASNFHDIGSSKLVDEELLQKLNIEKIE